MNDLSTLTIADARDMLRAGEVTSRRITEDCLAAIEDAGALNAFVTTTADKALAMAEAADQRRASGDDADLLGIPLGIKDLYCTEGVRSQAASRASTSASRTSQSKCRVSDFTRALSRNAR